ncbi:Palmitoyl-monogalactosyldiacylglycerol delta-7 desaturase [Durusdinium trenchii]|uniref:Chloroplastic (Acyl-lipid desaturase 3) (Fatty acid desaturase 5) (FAD5) (Fatty acid desaturase B) (FADB) (Monogalactosyldiacylglycerol-specific palmitic acid desaturase) n=1 Tax=Durusdinium trenchii TaxID=1381693 RepID=A0ABP0IT04_9DINO
MARSNSLLSLAAASVALLCLTTGPLSFLVPQFCKQAQTTLLSPASASTQGFYANATLQNTLPLQPHWAIASALLAALATRKLNKVGRAAQAKKQKPLRDQVAPENADAVREDRKKGSKNVKGGSKMQRFFSVRNRKFWDFTVWPRTYFKRVWEKKDWMYAVIFGIIHAGAFMAPWYFSWDAFAVFFCGYVITGLGITLSYHRQLAHLSFKTPKVVEYILAYCGALAMQSHPINWVSSHRHHHGATDTANDVHSPKDGFWWSHAGWLLDQKGTWMRVDRSNVDDLSKQWYYRFLQKTYPLHAIVLPIVGLYCWGGLPYVLWGFFARIVWTWHVTWAVNSVSHVWGFQDWNTGDISMNNWLIGILAFGEGWHNNHHAFETSCRHGLKWWQVDVTWYIIKLLETVGIASDLKYPTQAKMKKLSWDSDEAASAAIA